MLGEASTAIGSRDAGLPPSRLHGRSLATLAVRPEAGDPDLRDGTPGITSPRTGAWRVWSGGVEWDEPIKKCCSAVGARARRGLRRVGRVGRFKRSGRQIVDG